MTLYRRGSVTVEAIKASELLETAGKDFDALPGWVRTAIGDERLAIHLNYVDVKTTEGWNAASGTGREGSAWIVQRQTEHGELYPITGKAFEERYTRVPE